MRRTSGDRQWLELHGGKWRVSVAVPRNLHRRLGTRLKRSLGTDSLTLANRLKLRVVSELKAEIERARELAGGKPRPAIADALALRKLLTDAETDWQQDDVANAVSLKHAEILGAEIGWQQDEVTGDEYPIYDSARSAMANDFLAVAQGQATPAQAHHTEFMNKNPVTRRTRADDVRAMSYLTRWCVQHKVPATLEAITRKVAIRFMDDFDTFTGGLHPTTQNKYLNRLSRYWKYMLRREEVQSNVWDGLKVTVPKTKHDEEERAFTEEEMRLLLTGPAPQKLMDLMMIAALTGARIDAIVDLKVGDCIDGAFTFKPQKQEHSARNVPIHPMLAEIVKRRCHGKKSTDDFFPDWPGCKNADSLRERSFKASNAFTLYRRACGVDQRVTGKRRALTNFHSFRRWFITKAERAGFSGDLIAAIVGHKRSGITLGRYSEGPEMKQARRCVAAVKLPPLDGAQVSEPRALTPRHRSRAQ